MPKGSVFWNQEKRGWLCVVVGVGGGAALAGTGEGWSGGGVKTYNFQWLIRCYKVAIFVNLHSMWRALVRGRGAAV